MIRITWHNIVSKSIYRVNRDVQSDHKHSAPTRQPNMTPVTCTFLLPNTYNHTSQGWSVGFPAKQNSSLPWHSHTTTHMQRPKPTGQHVRRRSENTFSTWLSNGATRGSTQTLVSAQPPSAPPSARLSTAWSPRGQPDSDECEILAGTAACIARVLLLEQGLFCTTNLSEVVTLADDVHLMDT